MPDPSVSHDGVPRHSADSRKRSPVWYEKRVQKEGCRALPGLTRTAPGNDCRQRARDSEAPALRADDYQEDNLYHQSKAICHAKRAYMLAYPVVSATLSSPCVARRQGREDLV